MYSESKSHHMSSQYRMSNRYIALLILALLFFSANSQDAVQQNAATAEAPKVETPPPQAATSSQETPKAEATPAADDYVARINKIREQVANSKDLDHKYLEQKINEVIASLTPQQKELFESGLSSEARAAYEHYRQEHQREIEKEHEQYRQMEDAAAELSLSDQTLKREADEMKQYEETIKSIKYNDYQFQVEPMKSEDLQFTLPIDQQVAFVIRVFTDDDGVFGTVKNIEGEQPIRVSVYENRDRIVADGSFYSIKLLKFQGKANATYLVRFSNDGKKRMLAFYMSHILLDAHVGSKLTVEDVADHGRRINEIKENIQFRLQEQKDKLMLEKENEKTLITAFGHYYFYNIGEIVLLGIICVIQVESIRKLLISSSVV